MINQDDLDKSEVGNGITELEQIDSVCAEFYKNREIDFQIIKTYKNEYDCTISYSVPTEKMAKNVAEFLFDLNSGGIEEFVRICLIKLGIKDREFLSLVLQNYEKLKKSNISSKKASPIMKPSQTFKQG